MRRRRRSEALFKALALGAVCLAVGVLALLLLMIGGQASRAFSHYMLKVELDWEEVAANPALAQSVSLSAAVSELHDFVRADLTASFPAAREDRRALVELNGMVNRLAFVPVASRIVENPLIAGDPLGFEVALSDDIDLFLKGTPRYRREVWMKQTARLDVENGQARLIFAPGAGLSAEDGVVLVHAGGAVLRLTDMEGEVAPGELLAGRLPRAGELTPDRVIAYRIETPELERSVTDRQIAWALLLQEQGRLKSRFNKAFLINADSTYPELAGVSAAIVGSIFLMLVTAGVAMPVGMAAALYLEEFAPRNRLTRLIEVNINNLAAVPSIVFGLLGAAVFINFLGMPRSAPLVGGFVLGLMTLPTIILSARAALRAVSQSVRDAALGLGASKSRAVFDHVLPLAAPGILTGAIIGLSRALGETAPLLLIGMVAFVAEAPSGPGDESTALPVLIYKWSTGAERAWEPATAAAIVILLAFMVLMNAAAVLLRRRFDRTQP